MRKNIFLVTKFVFLIMINEIFVLIFLKKEKKKPLKTYNLWFISSVHILECGHFF